MVLLVWVLLILLQLDRLLVVGIPLLFLRILIFGLKVLRLNRLGISREILIQSR